MPATQLRSCRRRRSRRAAPGQMGSQSSIIDHYLAPLRPAPPTTVCVCSPARWPLWAANENIGRQVHWLAGWLVGGRAKAPAARAHDGGLLGDKEQRARRLHSRYTTTGSFGPDFAPPRAFPNILASPAPLAHDDDESRHRLAAPSPSATPARLDRPRAQVTTGRLPVVTPVAQSHWRACVRDQGPVWRESPRRRANERRILTEARPRGRPLLVRLFQLTGARVCANWASGPACRVWEKEIAAWPRLIKILRRKSRRVGASWQAGQ